MEPRLPVMAPLAERLPVVLIPEESLVSPVGNDMIHHRRPDILAGLQTFGAERMNKQELSADLVPSAVVSPAGSRVILFRMQRPVSVAVFGSLRDKVRASRMAARSLRLVRHNQLSQISSSQPVIYTCCPNQ